MSKKGKKKASKTLDELFADLRGADVTLRSRAINALCATPVEQLALADSSLLLIALDDPNITILKAMAVAVAHKGERAAVPQLRRLVGRKFVSETALSALLQLGASPWDVLIDLLHEEDPLLRTAAIELLEVAARKHAQPTGSAGRGENPWSYKERRIPRETADKLVAKLTGVKESDAVSSILSALADHNVNVRTAAVRALGRLATPVAVPALVDMLSDPDSEVREEAIEALEATKDIRAVPGLTSALSDTDPTVRTAAAQALGLLAHLPSVVATLVGLLTNPDAAMRRVAIEALEDTKGEGVAQSLISALSDEDPHVRYVATRALRHRLQEPTEDAVVPAFIHALRDNDTEVRRAAQQALIAAGDRTLPSVFDALKDTNDIAREAAARIVLALAGAPYDLSKPHPAMMRHQAELIDIAKSPHSEVRRAAVETLGRLGNRSSVPVLLDALADGDAAVRALATRALRRIGDARLIPALVGMLSDSDAAVRMATVEALRGFKDPRAVTALIAALSDHEPSVRAMATRKLASLKDLSSATAALVQLLRDPSAWVRETVIEVLMSRRVGEAVPALIAALSDKEPTVRALAAQALGELGSPDAEPAVLDGLRKAARDTVPMVRTAAVNALGDLGDRTSIGALVDALSDSVTASSPATQARSGYSWNPYIDAFDEQTRSELFQEGMQSAALGAMASADGPLWLDKPPTIADRAARALEQVAEKAGAKSVLFTSYYPKEVSPEEWYSLHVYCYQVAAVREIRADAQVQLGIYRDDFRESVSKESQQLAEGVLVTVTPLLDGFIFNPPSIRVRYLEDWHRSDFRLRANGAASETASNGRVVIAVEGVEVAEIPLSIFVRERSPITQISVEADDRGDSGGPPSTRHMRQTSASRDVAQPITEGTASATTLPRGRIFCSYSHRDEKIVLRVERACKALGIDFLRDTTTLKSGERWSPRLLKLIDEADVFQLFWSNDAFSSRNVELEWRYALRFDSEHRRFICPVFWQSQKPPIPEELKHLHFSYVPELSRAE